MHRHTPLLLSCFSIAAFLTSPLRPCLSLFTEDLGLHTSPTVPRPALSPLILHLLVVEPPRCSAPLHPLLLPPPLTCFQSPKSHTHTHRFMPKPTAASSTTSNPHARGGRRKEGCVRGLLLLSFCSIIHFLLLVSFSIIPFYACPASSGIATMFLDLFFFLSVCLSFLPGPSGGCLKKHMQKLMF